MRDFPSEGKTRCAPCGRGRFGRGLGRRHDCRRGTPGGARHKRHKTYSIVKDPSLVSGAPPLAANFCSHSGEAYRRNPTVGRGQTSDWRHSNAHRPVSALAGRPGSPSEERSDSLTIKYTSVFQTGGIENAMLLKESGIGVCSEPRPAGAVLGCRAGWQPAAGCQPAQSAYLKYCSL